MKTFIIIAFFTALVSAVTTIVGFGVGTIMTPVLVLFLPYQQVLLVVGWIHFATSLMKTIVFRHYLDWEILIKSGIPAVFASALGAALIPYVEKSIFLRILGAVVLVHIIIELIDHRFKIPRSLLTLVLGGVITGFFAGFLGIRGILVAIMLSSFNVSKKAFIGVTGAFSVLVDMVRLIIYHYNFDLEPTLAYGLLFYIPLSLASVQCASYVVSYISVRTFRYLVAGAISVIGLKLLIMGG